MIGITAYGGYIPRLRLDRMSIFNAMGWFAPATIMVAQGERSMCNWDEDALTMAVAAAWDCLSEGGRSKIDACYLASTTLPFSDRQNAGILKAALNLPDDVLTADVTGSLKAGTTALVTALEAVASGERRTALVTASDRRETKAAYFYEMWFGDGAASLLVGSDDSDELIAQLLGTYSVSRDFVDHYRGTGRRFDYMWEERWVRDLGYSQVIPEVVEGLLRKCDVRASEVDKLVFPCFFKAEHRNIAKRLGVAPERVQDTMHEVCGETGAAHPLVMLVRALEEAKPGDKILVASFGQGSDALLFEVTDAIQSLPERAGIRGALARKKTIDNYPKFLKFRELIETEMGVRAEVPMQTAMTVLWRRRKMLLGLVGGRCKECGTPQFPKSEVCVNPACVAMHSQEDYEFSQRRGKIKTFTGDLLAVSVDPPAAYGMIQFDGGGRFMSDFTDYDMESVKVGAPFSMSFRKRYYDRERGFTGYFWKAVPEKVAEAPRQIRFDGRVAIVTGGGGALGRAYALELSKRGAKVVVADLGGAADGSGGGSKGPADEVVDEIRRAGGEAVACYESVATPEGGKAIVDKALEAFGRLDILINNAGILRDRTLVKLSPEDWKAVLDVHLTGAYNVTRPALGQMKEGGYGRIVMTTSAAGLYGNFGQTNYSAAKLGLVGFMNTVRLEGKKAGVLVNTVAPLAASRLTKDLLPPDMMAKLAPEHVVPVTLYLCSEECTDSGLVLNVGAGCVNRAAMLTNDGIVLRGDDDGPTTPEEVERRWEALNDLAGAKEHSDAMTFAMAAVQRAMTTGAGEEEEAGGASGGGGGEVARVFDERLPAAFKADAAADAEVVFGFDIKGEGQWTVAIKGGALEVTRGLVDKPTVTIIMNGADFLELVAGKLDAMAAYTLGKLKLTGDVMKSRLFMKLFAFGGE